MTESSPEASETERAISAQAAARIGRAADGALVAISDTPVTDELVFALRDELRGITAIRLRRLRLSDADDVLRAFTSAADMARQGDVTSKEEAVRYVADLLEPRHLPWAIDVDDRLVGLVCVTVDERNRAGWFWYWMSAEARGRGWTSRAAATVAHWALGDGGLERLELGHRVDNPASEAVARAAGFVAEGLERGKFLIDGERIDVRTYGRLCSDPEPPFDALPMLADPAD